MRALGSLDRSAVRRDITEVMKTTVSSKGQIGLPAELREQDHIEPGEEFTVERLDRGEYRLVRRTPPRNGGVVDMPVKDSLIAATAIVHDLIVATHNRTDFENAGVKILDPFAG